MATTREAPCVNKESNKEGPAGRIQPDMADLVLAQPGSGSGAALARSDEDGRRDHAP